MIRVFVFVHEQIPRSVKETLEQIREFEPLSEAASAQLMLFYAARWNRGSISKIPSELRQSIPLIVLCDTAEQPFTRDSLFRGEVSAVISANASPQQIAAAAAATIAGLQVHQRWEQPAPANVHPILTPRELEILRLLADGEGNKTIADLLNISPHTVKFHISSIFEKLNVLNRTEAVRAGITLGLLSI